MKVLLVEDEYNLAILLKNAIGDNFANFMLASNGRDGIKKFKQYSFPGGYSDGDTPVPIPNTEVKLFSADGTAWETAWESRTPPDTLKKAQQELSWLGFLRLWTKRFFPCY